MSNLNSPEPTTRPTGTITFLFTDIEGSTRRWETNSASMQAAHAQQEAILRRAIEANGGYAYKMVGDAFQVAFSTPLNALQAAVDAQRALHEADWGEAGREGELKVRMALHTGVTEERAGDYVGPALNRIARLMSAGHGGQTLMTLATEELVRDHLPPGTSLRDAGLHRLKDLIRPEHSFQVVIDGLPSDFPPLKTLDARPNNLPIERSILVGREKELADIAGRLLRPQVGLLTLTGPGGTGKTRLALQTAANLIEHFEDGAFFVDLSPVTELSVAVSSIAQSIGVQEVAGTPLIDTLKEYLRERRLLLVLDNFEQVTQAARQVSQLLASAPHLKALVTSRVPLRLHGEHEYAVPPLALPDPRQLPSLERMTQYEAVRLFIERAQEVKSDFEVTNSNAPAVAEICVRLDGLPLAIELAAARVRMFPPQALLTRLQSRLKMLTGGAIDLPARQQTLRGAIEWSYDLLAEGERQIFWRMAVFSGGRTCEGVEAVCNYDGQLPIDALEGLESLVSKSLLQQREGLDDEPRFWMLETIQEYANEKLAGSGEADEQRRAHAAYYLGLAEQAETQLLGPGQEKWLKRLDDEHDNMRAALRWSRERGEQGDAEAVKLGLRMAGALYRFWLLRGYFTEGQEHFAALLTTGTGGTSASISAGDKPAETSQGATPDTPTISTLPRAKALLRMGGLAWTQGDYTLARAALVSSLAAYRELSDIRGTASSLLNLGNVAFYQVDLEEARALYSESLALYRQLGDRHGVASALTNRGIVAHYQKDYEAAGALLRESLELYGAMGDKHGMGQALNCLGDVAVGQEKPDEAHAHYTESLQINSSLGYKWGIVESLEGLARVALLEGDAQRATRLTSASHTLRQSIHAPVPPAEVQSYEKSKADMLAALEEEAWSAAWTEGAAMSIEQAVRYALDVERKT